VVEALSAFDVQAGVVEEAADGRPEFVPGPGRGPAQHRLEHGDVEDGRADRGERLADAVEPARRQIVEDHDVARCERPRQELLVL
jgi:hypothetical protein